MSGRVRSLVPGRPRAARVASLALVVLMLLLTFGVTALLAAPAGQAGGESDAQIERYVEGHSLAVGERTPADLSAASLTASPGRLAPNGTARLTLTIPNAGQQDAALTARINLPRGLSYVDHACAALVTQSCAVAGGAVVWSGTAVAGQTATVTVDVRADRSLTTGTGLAATAALEAGAGGSTLRAGLTVDTAAISPVQFLPLSVYGMQPEPPQVVLSTTEPNGANGWTVSWTAGQGVSGYELQESQDPTFASVTTYPVGGTSLYLEKDPSPFNVYYYRVRSIVGTLEGPWSNVGRVVGGYFDDFTSDNTGWQMRRMTNIERLRTYYQIDDERDWFVMQVEDRWDWAIASPGMPAPRVPYVIEYDAKILKPANLLSFGAVFGGDWPSVSGCPTNPTSLEGWAQHTDCFNHFYNTNTIFYGPLKLLFERVDSLYWCPNDCGGSRLKRLGDLDTGDVKTLVTVSPEEWNTYRIEVREDSIKFFSGKRGAGLPKLEVTYKDTRWIHEPYFGIFASTDEYNNSWWAFDNYLVMPIDE